MKRKSRNTGGITVQQALEGVSASINALNLNVSRFQQFVGRAHFPAEAMELLAGELRAVRTLLDEKGTFRFVDGLHTRYADYMAKLEGVENKKDEGQA